MAHLLDDDIVTHGGAEEIIAALGECELGDMIIMNDGIGSRYVWRYVDIGSRTYGWTRHAKDYSMSSAMGTATLVDHILLSADKFWVY